MNFLEAVEAMKQGKKVTRSIFEKNGLHYYYEENSNRVLTSLGQDCYLDLILVSATDWEIYEKPKKTLWDKRKRINEGYFGLPDVKEALKEFIDYLQDGMDTEDMPRADWCVQLKAKEIFGDELL